MTLEKAKKLSPEEINRVIAIALGWKWYKAVKDGRRFLYHPAMIMGYEGLIEATEQDDIAAKGYRFWDHFNQLCDYFHDLNACANAEEFLFSECGEQICRIYIDTLVCLVRPNYFTVMAPANLRAIALACVLSERKK